jgi:hypothetical protein
LAWTFPPIPCLWLAHFLGLPSLTPYNTSTSQLCHFNYEDGDSMFLWNIGIDLWNYVAPKPKTTWTLHYPYLQNHHKSVYIFVWSIVEPLILRLMHNST